MKPVIIIPLGLMSQADVKKLGDNDFCVVRAKDPAKVKFLDPIPARASRTAMENAAIQLSRVLLNGTWQNANQVNVSRSDAARWFVEFLVKGTPLDVRGSVEEQEKEIFDREKREEIWRLARQEAREERAKAKAVEAAKHAAKAVPAGMEAHAKPSVLKIPTPDPYASTPKA